MSLENDSQAGETLIAPVMRGGKRLAAAPTLTQIREHAARELGKLPEPLRKLEAGIDYPVEISKALRALCRADG